ncbi:hypothetical protein ABZP36_011659 [Zizania latifolia]
MTGAPPTPSLPDGWRILWDGVDPATVLRVALAEALVHYYPLAGRIVEASPRRKLLVEYTGEGVVFIEADAAAALEELGEYDTGDVVRVQFVVNSRGRGRNGNGPSLLPEGYYGNVFLYAIAESPARELRRRPFGHALRLVVAAKARAMEEGHLQSVADLMATHGRPQFMVARTYVVSDLTWSRLPDVDVG